MTQSLHDYVIGQLQAAKGRWREIAEKSDVSLRTLEKIARREIEDPGISHIEKLAGYFRGQKDPPHHVN